MTTRRGAVLAALALSLIGCSADRPITTHAGGDPTADAAWEAAAGVPEDEGLDSHVLLELTEWIRDHPVPMFSFLVSRNGRLVYELYTSALTREHAHYLMSVTKSVVSALVGIAIDRGLVSGPDASIAEILPRRLFASDADVARFRRVTIRHVLGMSALDAPDPPRVNTPEARARERQFWAAPNRVAFALAQPLLTRPGREYQYNDVTPMLASGVVQYASGKSALEFAEETLFAPMRFRHHEWMHQDASGVDMGGYGLRLRPIDMQKFGVLYLRGGDWGARTLVPRAWVERSFSPWNRSRPDARDLDYGWFWWTYDGRSGWTTHSAIGWKGQRIAVLPRQRLVVTMTGAWESSVPPREPLGHEVLWAVRRAARVCLRCMRDGESPREQVLRTVRRAPRPGPTGQPVLGGAWRAQARRNIKRPGGRSFAVRASVRWAYRPRVPALCRDFLSCTLHLARSRLRALTPLGHGTRHASLNCLPAPLFELPFYIRFELPYCPALLHPLRTTLLHPH